MKSHRVLIALSLMLLAAGCSIWERGQTSSPFETESAFLKSYAPTNVLNRFNDGQASYSHGNGAAFGHDSVTHEANFDGDFALCSEKFVPLMDALSDDVAAQLVGNGARILSQIGEARAGFHFDYKLGKTVGSVTITPLELTPTDPASILGHSKPVPNCMVGVHTSIKVAEKWFAKEPGLMQISVSDSIQ
ncbi:MAG TPA: hypothetical protein VFO46_19560 [Candidatus Sulfotelmatobacter sp.]|nr:hypothetical protein [Candidatus Sulfotelmatobacter sp.]